VRGTPGDPTARDLVVPRPRAAYHPDFHRRSRSSTWSTGRWLRSGRGLSPPVRTCTDPGARVSGSSMPAAARAGRGGPR